MSVLPSDRKYCDVDAINSTNTNRLAAAASVCTHTKHGDRISEDTLFRDVTVRGG